MRKYIANTCREDLNDISQWNEEDLFRYLKCSFYHDLEKAKDPLSNWDCYSKQYRHRIELKCRTKHFEGLLIEKKKFISLTNKASKHLDVPIYINCTPSGVFSFNLLKFDPDWFTYPFNKTKMFEETQKVDKVVAMLPVKEAEVL